MAGQAFGVVGLEVMGRNLALNVERNGYPIAVYNRTTEKTDHFLNVLAKGKNAKGGKTPAEFVALLEKPRRILMMVKAGKPVDAVIAELKPLLEPGDILIDGGNSLFTDTERRSKELAPTGIRFFGMGVSGGEEGALWGPSMMPGGDQESYKHLEPILTKVAAKSDSGPCVAYLGSGGAGHFVKMVHNGIEYGDMQLIAEAYDLLKNVVGMSNSQLRETFDEWNKGELKSFLIEITSKVIDFKDPDGTGKDLVDLICSYAQGFAMLAAADKEFKFGLHLPVIAKIWKAGCIIRAVFLDEITKAFTADPNLANLLLADQFKDSINKKQDAWRRVLSVAINNGIATPAFSTSLAYYDSYRRARVPANLIQAQRDFFGAHTYERIDKPGTFHTEWADESSHHPGSDLNAKDAVKPTHPQ